MFFTNTIIYTYVTLYYHYMIEHKCSQQKRSQLTMFNFLIVNIYLQFGVAPNWRVLMGRRSACHTLKVLLPRNPQQPAKVLNITQSVRDCGFWPASVTRFVVALPMCRFGCPAKGRMSLSMKEGKRDSSECYLGLQISVRGRRWKGWDFFLWIARGWWKTIMTCTRSWGAYIKWTHTVFFAG